MARVPKSTVLDALPPVRSGDLLPEIRRRVGLGGQKIVVLDDDPTGTQTVHDVSVLTTWSVDALSAELVNDAPAFYVLTNSRSLPTGAAQALAREIGANLKAAMRATGRDAVVISRSDSTLRGHFPAEVDALTAALDRDFDACLVIPCFFEGRRYTIDDVHYVQEGDDLVPAAETPFAQDTAFGYRASNLRDWVTEKTAGRVPASEVASISIDLLRRGAVEPVRDALLELKNGAVCVVNAADYGDLEVLVQALLDAEDAGRRFIYRTAASFVRVRAGIEPRPLLTRDDVRLDDGTGVLVVVGSYVPKSTRQLDTLLHQPDVHPIEIDVRSLIDPHTRADEIKRVTAQADAHLIRNHTTVIFTRRQLITGANAEESLSIGQSISDGLVAIVQAIRTRPRYVLAKGGITSSDVAIRGLGIRRALVAGQISPGIPLWLPDESSRYPQMPYVVFPGNVGSEDALAQIVEALKPVSEAR